MFCLAPTCIFVSDVDMFHFKTEMVKQKAEKCNWSGRNEDVLKRHFCLSLADRLLKRQMLKIWEFPQESPEGRNSSQRNLSPLKKFHVLQDETEIQITMGQWQADYTLARTVHILGSLFKFWSHFRTLGLEGFAGFLCLSSQCGCIKSIFLFGFPLLIWPFYWITEALTWDIDYDPPVWWHHQNKTIQNKN